MGFFKTVLFGKVDLDTIMTAFVLGVRPEEQETRALKGSASGEELINPLTLCLEVGGAGRVGENNFDHHNSSGQAVNLSACAQALERLARLVRYADEIDRGIKYDLGQKQDIYPSLVQLVSGMLLSIKDPQEQVLKGLELLRMVLQSGIDPYGTMAEIVKFMPEAHEWLERKREHEKLFEKVCAEAKWFTTKNGKKVAVVETTWVGAPGALYGEGADIVIALNPRYERAGKSYRKFTIAGHGVSVIEAGDELKKLESGWAGPDNNPTIIGSPWGCDSNLSLETVTGVVVSNL